MDLQNRRITRSSTGNENSHIGVKENVKITGAAITRRAFADQRNTKVIRNVKAEIVDRELVKPVRHIKASPQKHPELVGLEREYQTADFMDDVYTYLLSKEKEFVIPESSINKNSVTAKMRSILVDWLVQVHGRFHLFAETLHLSIYLLDATLANMKVEKTELQLVGMACMLVASKYEEMYVPDIKDFEYIADNAFTKRQIMNMETKVLRTTNFALSRPHSITFLRWLTKEANSTHRQHNMAKYFGEIALLDSTLSNYLPSQVALISLFLAGAITHKQLDVKPIINMITWTEDGLTTGVSLFAKAILRLHGQEKLIAIKNKYSSSKQSSVSVLTEDDLNVLKRF